MAIAEAIAGIIQGAAGIVFSVLDIFGIGGNSEKRRLNQQIANATVLHDMVLLKDKTEGVIFAIDIWRNIQRLDELHRALSTYVHSGRKSTGGYQKKLLDGLCERSVHSDLKSGVSPLILADGSVAPFRQTERLKTMPNIMSPSQALTNYNSIQSPASAYASNIIVDARGYYAAKNQFILPSLLAGDNQETFENFHSGYISVAEFLHATNHGQRWFAQWSREHDKLDRQFHSATKPSQILTDMGKLITRWTITSKEKAFKFAAFELKKYEL